MAEKSICDGCSTQSMACRLNDSASQCAKWKSKFSRKWDALTADLRKQWGLDPPDPEEGEQPHD